MPLTWANNGSAAFASRITTFRAVGTGSCEDVAQASLQQVVVLGVLRSLLHPARDARRVNRREVLGDVAAD